MKIKRNVLLNPGPGTTSDEVKWAMLVPDICPREEEFCQVMESIKQDLPKVVYGEKDYTSVLFTASGTGGVEAAITSAIPVNGKLLIVENGAYGARQSRIAEYYKIPSMSYKLAYGDYPDLNMIEQYLKSDPEISHVSMVHHETTTGMLNPVEDICKLAHAYNKEVIVDTVSSFAGVPINLDKWQAEYIISSSNKCIQGMPGLTFVIFKKSLLEQLNGRGRSHYFDIYAQYKGFHDSGQMQFTPPVQVVYALRKALDLFFQETIEGRINRYRENYSVLHDGLRGMGFKFLLPDDQQSGILLAIKEPRNPEYSFTQMHDYMYERGFTIYPGKGAKEATFRLAVLGDLYKQDIEDALSALGGYLKSVGIHAIL